MKVRIRSEVHVMALAQFCKRLTYEDAYRKASACDGEEKRKAYAGIIIEAIEDLEKSLREAGYSPR